MEFLILLLLSSATLATGKSTDPNDEPFLPIYPVYPYSPKLIKRGTEKDAATQLTPELYTPKLETQGTYNANLGTNYPRDPYYPTYNPYPKASTPSTSYNPYYASTGYTYSSTPYNVYNPYSSTSYSSTPYSSTPYPSTPYSPPYSMTPGYSTLPYSSASYPSYYYQNPYYYPNYYNQPLFPPPPSPGGYDYSNYKNPYTEADAGNKGDDKKANGEKSKDGDSSQESASAQFVDGGNYISGNTKDLDGQPSTEKAANQYNQLGQVSELSLKGLSIPLPKTTYRVISVAGQPVGPDYPLPAPYIRAQQLEQLMSQTISKLLTQNAAQQQQLLQQQQQQANNQYVGYDVNANTLPTTNNEASYMNANNYKDNEPYVSIPNVIAKTGLAYVINPTLLGKLTAGQTTRQTVQTPTALTTLTKSTDYAQPAYDGMQNSEKEQATDQQDDYGNYENQGASVTSTYDKENQTYPKEQAQPTVYDSQNYVTVRTPHSFSYRYTSYSPNHSHGRRASQRYKSNQDDANFGAKETSKG